MIKQSNSFDNLRVITIQSCKLKVNGREYPKDICNYSNALPVYNRLFGDYNKKFGTSYNHFFWGFSELLKKDLKSEVKRGAEMIGYSSLDKDVKEKVFILEVPKSICLETNFYCFSDEIFAYEFPDELESKWETIYMPYENVEKQVIFPFIEENMIKEIHPLKDFLQ